MTSPSLQPNFNRVARLYAAAEYLTLGPLLERTRTHFLPWLAGRRRALVFGDGDGRFLAAFLRTNPHVQATAVDSSAAMLALLRRRTAFAADRVTTLHANALQLRLDTHDADTRPDLVVTHFFLDCLTQPELDRLVRATASTLAPGALWLLSDFRIPTTRPALWRAAARLYVRALYLAFRILTGLQVTHLPDPQTTLRQCGFARVAAHESLFGLLYTELWQ